LLVGPKNEKKTIEKESYNFREKGKSGQISKKKQDRGGPIYVTKEDGGKKDGLRAQNEKKKLSIRRKRLVISYNQRTCLRGGPGTHFFGN